MEIISATVELFAIVNSTARVSLPIVRTLLLDEGTLDAKTIKPLKLLFNELTENVGHSFDKGKICRRSVT